MSPSEPAFACDLTRLSAADRERLFQNSREILAQPSEVRELPDGYALGFSNASPQLLATICDFIVFDRLCCPFMQHELLSEAHGGITWLRLTGAPGVKEFIGAEVLATLGHDVRHRRC
jgi:hypothetical protein